MFSSSTSIDSGIPWPLAYPGRQAIVAGPPHLLLALLENRQLEISEVDLVAITSCWKAPTQAGRFPPQSLCDFVDVAPRRMALKARCLRPAEEQTLEIEPEDEGRPVSHGPLGAMAPIQIARGRLA